MPEPALLIVGSEQYHIAPTRKAIRLVAANGTVLYALDPLTGVEVVGGVRVGLAGVFGLGTPEEVTIASGIAIVTRPYVNLLPESSTADTVDSFTYAAAQEGDLLMVMSRATNTITLDNSATLLLGAGTRDLAPGGSCLLQKVGTTWVERAFTTAAA